MTHRAHRRRTAILFGAFVISAVIIGLLVYRKYQQSLLAPSPPVQTPGARRVTLFFADSEGEGLRREVRELDPCETTAACIEAITDELVNGPVGDLEPTLPTTFALRGADVVGDMAVIDLEKGSEEGLPKGSSAEMVAVYSVVDTIVFNYPQVKKVQFLLDGEPVETLGHLDMRQPLLPDFTLVR